MRTLLRHTRTGQYLQAPEKWADHPVLGYDFRFIDRATRYVQLWGLKDVELAFSFDNSDIVTTASLEQATVCWAA
jgi:hypothetical protein